MPYLIATILFQAVFSQLQKWFVRRRSDVLLVAFVNYLVAALVAAAYLGWRPAGAFPPALVITGVLAGVSYSLGLMVGFWAVRVAGVLLAGAANRLAVVMPTVLSIFIWSEIPNAYQTAALVLIGAALAVLSASRAPAGVPDTGRTMAWALLAVFLISGVSRTMAKVFHEQGLDHLKVQYVLVLYTTATLFCGILCRGRWGRINRDVLAAGAGLGLCNVLGNLAVLAALERLPGIVVFPVVSSGGLVAVSLMGMALWGERLDRLGAAGMALTLAALVLMGL